MSLVEKSPDNLLVSILKLSTETMLIMISRIRTQQLCFENRAIKKVLYLRVLYTVAIIVFNIVQHKTRYTKKQRIEKKIIFHSNLFRNFWFHFNDYVLFVIIGFNVSFPFK